MSNPNQQKVKNEAERAELARLRICLHKIDGLMEYLDKVSRRATAAESERDLALKRATEAETERDSAARIAQDERAKLQQKYEDELSQHRAGMGDVKQGLRGLLSIINHDETTVLFKAAEKGDEATIQLLLDCGADKEAKDSKEWTALHHAASGGHDSIVYLLVNTLSVDKEAKNEDGSTSLHLAAKNGHESTVRLLVNTLHVNKEAKDHEKRAALDIARET
ncbi:ankyrin repeat-containing domain protein [Trichophaea hybrida]|nr:ankyrin repeat-containing domain protein [Trichophaea hybrida]